MSRRRTRSPSADRTSTSKRKKQDPYYGQEETATLCAKFVTHLFACSDPAPLSQSSPPVPPLAHFIAYAFHRTRLHSTVTFAALYLLQRLRTRCPGSNGASGHRVFITVFMVASKVVLDGTYSNKAWSAAAQDMFPLKDLNQMEREVLRLLEWRLKIDPIELVEFSAKVQRDFKGPGPYPRTYVVPAPAPSPIQSTTSHNAKAAGTSPASSPDACSARSPSTSPTDPSLDPLTIDASPPPDSMAGTPLSTLQTPELWGSPSGSPASAGWPSTPAGYEDRSVRVTGTGPAGTIGNSNLATTTDSDSDPRSPATTSHVSGTSSGTVTRAARAGNALVAENLTAASERVGSLLTRAIPCLW
ncbi:hypothetical protein LXA43DRAFT_1142920 [Ganoderma leucocontextum]|nr:hypothetical protein LXA43DRAFT_1142920 [Ganoderma leucocontextum]